MGQATTGVVTPVFGKDADVVTYPGSNLRFRGPAGDIDDCDVLCLGGTETFGRLVASPFPARLAAATGRRVLNLGVAGAGLDVVRGDPVISGAMERARAIVLQVPGAQSLSNRFYTVHPRRNDRFVKASGILRTIYRDVDFTEFHFTRHMLDRLRSLSPERFSIVMDELREAWCARMALLLEEAPAPVHLLWLSRRAPDAPEPVRGLGPEPMFVTEAMLGQVSVVAASLSVVVSEIGDVSDMVAATPDRRRRAAAAAARQLPGPGAHARAAEMLAAHLIGEAENAAPRTASEKARPGRSGTGRS